MKATILLTSCTIASSSAFQIGSMHQRRRTAASRPPTARQMKPSSEEFTTLTSERRRTSLSAATLGSLEDDPRSLLAALSPPNSEWMTAVTQVISASLLVTGNTVGSSMFVLPEAVKSVGLAWGSVIFVGEYCLFSLAIGLVRVCA